MLVRLLRTYLRPFRWWLVAVVVFQSLQALAALYLPRLNGDIIDNGVAKGDTGYIWRHGGWMLAVSALQVVFTAAAVYYGSRAAMGFGRDVRAGLFHKVTDFSSREVTTFGAPSLITRVTNDVGQVQMLVQMTCTMFLAAPVTIIGGTIMALQEDVGLAWIPVVAIIVLAIAVGNVLKRMVPNFRTMQVRIDEVNRVLREQITGIRVVRAFVREPYERERFAETNARLTKVALRGGRLMGFMFPTAIVAVNISSVAVLWFGSNKVSTGEMQIGSLFAFLQYLLQILMSVMMASWITAIWPRASVSAERIQEVLLTDSSIGEADAAVREYREPSSVELRNAGFQYPGAAHPVLAGVSVRCEAGSTLAVIGSTGAGKTTLVSAIARLIDVTDGAVLVNGVDVRKVAPELLWNRIGLVPQRPYLFAGTVASNLRYGKPDATEAEMWEALEIAQAAEFVRAMPGGLEAPIAQGGTNVSGGQRQRLSIARAFVRRPDVYLFDDSFSALDMATDARLRAAMQPYTQDAAVVVVAQRVTSIKDADQILVLEDGEPVGLGTHEHLLATCDTYQEIVSSQLTAEEAGRTT